MSRILFLIAVLLCVGAAALEVRCTADMHGNLKGLSELTAVLDINSPEILRIDAGDTIQGTFLSRNDKGRSMIAAMNLLNYDVWVPGNHDFEF